MKRFLFVFVVALLFGTGTAYAAKEQVVKAVPSVPPGTTAKLTECVTPTWCTGLGTRTVNGTAVPVMVVLTKGKWRYFSAPPQVAGTWSHLTCATTTACFAISGSWADGKRPRAAAWNGSRWKLLPDLPPAPDGSAVNDVDCPAPTNCVVVGGAALALIGGTNPVLAATWNGRAWTSGDFSHAPTRGQLRKVSCGAVGECVAVGSVIVNPEFQWSGEHIERLSGGRWSEVKLPATITVPDYLWDIDCPTPNWCAAVGNGTRPTDGYPSTVTITGLPSAPVARFNGVAPVSYFIPDIDCWDRGACVALGSWENWGEDGSSHVFVEQLRRGTWSEIAYPGGTTTSVYGDRLDCVARNRCFVV